MSDFKPKIIVFCCNWCSYAGADLAGISRYPITPHFRVIRTLCSARVDPEWVLEAFNKGADGVMVAGCHPGDCHYIGGNYRTRRRVAMLRSLVAQFGLQPDRLQLAWISAGEAEKFAATINGFVQRITELGPSPFRRAPAVPAAESAKEPHDA
ncbi:MAG: Methyl-viologen-reducing hydrogenase, delta subunit [Lentisphaerae bacterium ADurb.BinA184]|nr:MAG: Methyl-viologen-reducing hydrogenase, delta subunit [Lentisphaerae bacterium ADurb.BinA184]